MSYRDEGGSDPYRLPQSVEDRYLQNIIDHTRLFSASPSAFAQLPNTRNLAVDPVLSSLHHGESDPLHELDDFDRNVMGLPPRQLPASNFHPTQPQPTDTFSQPQSRVIGDASHHFRPFVHRGPDYQPPSFSSNSLQTCRVQPSPPSQDGRIRSHPQRNTESRQGARLLPTPSSNREHVQEWKGELSLTHEAHESYSSMRKSASRSPSELGGSSPSARLTSRHQAPTEVAVGAQSSQRWVEKFQLDLNHARSVPPIIRGTQLVDPRQSLPDRFRSVFPFDLFNIVQSKCFPVVYGTEDNVVVSAPTGSGKTAILELAICKLLNSPGGSNFKIIYQSPTKSLCAERTNDWQRKFAQMGLKCAELTGDTSPAQARRVGDASIIVTTPEKWDSITRKWSDHRKLLELVRLVLIDEVHILKDARGATLEAVVSRMKTIGANVRFVALSATVPNIQDVAKWLGKCHSNQSDPAHFEVFGEELRPVKLQKYVYGYEGSTNDFVFEKTLNGKLPLLLAKHSKNKPIMVFCYTRKSCEKTARDLAEWWSTVRSEERAWPTPTKRIAVSNANLQELLSHGVAFHHAGLDSGDRSAIEKAFLEGHLFVICCTSTLAVGVNLPCHTVVLKGTSCYIDGQQQECSDLEVMQMLGRAGRPQFDSSATAIIMTRKNQLNRYTTMISGNETLESTLHHNLIEHLNSEIGLGTIKNIKGAKEWVGGTFLSVRMRQSPSRYQAEDVNNAAGADARMQEWCERDIKELQKYGLVTDTEPLACTEYGNAMARYMVQFETMKLLLSTPWGADMEEVLTTFCKADELKEFRWKPAERAVCRTLGQSPFILFPMKEALNYTWQKVSLLVQIFLGGVELPNDKEHAPIRKQMGAQKVVIFDRVNRLARCFIDCRAHDQDAASTRAGLELARSFAANAWENKPAQLSQIPNFGPVAVRKWVSHGVNTVLGVAEKDFVDIERISSRNPPFGSRLLKILDDFPRLTLRADIEKTSPKPNPKEEVVVNIKVHLGHCNAKHPPEWRSRVPGVTFMAETSEGHLGFFWRGSINQIDPSQGLDLKFPVAISESTSTITCYFSCEEIVGTQVTKKLIPDFPASAFNRPTTLKRSKIAKCDDEFDLEDVEESDMLDALAAVGPDVHRLPLEASGPSADETRCGDGEALARTESDTGLKMNNGKWMCNHHCRNGGLTKSGKPCVHKCCHEGLEKPRPPPSQKLPKAEKKQDAHGNTAEQASSKAHASLEQSSTAAKSQNSATQGQSLKRKSVEQAAPPCLQGSHKRGKLGTNNESTEDKPPKTDPFELLFDSDASEDAEVPTLAANAMDSPDGVELAAENPCTSVGVVVPHARNSAVQSSRSHARGVDSNSVGIPPDSMLLDSDWLSDDDEFPDIAELFAQANTECTKTPDRHPAEETLYPGVIDTLRDSFQRGSEPNLSFTTVNELQKASDRLDLSLPSHAIGDHSAQPRPEQLGLLRDHPYGGSEHADIHLEVDVDRSEEVGYLDDDWQTCAQALDNLSAPRCSERGSPPPESRAQGENPGPAAQQNNEPAWVSDLPSDIVDMFRGCVEFVD